MIKNIPDPKDFYQASLNYMNISWGMAFEIYKNSKEVLEDDGDIEEYREAQRYQLNTALMLLSQSIELFLKYKICQINPFLFVHLKNEGVNCDFSELQSVDAKDLLNLHDQVQPVSLGSRLKKTFEEIRKKRNKIMHSSGIDIHHEEEILIQIIKLSDLLFNKTWLSLRIEAHGNAYFSDSYVNTYDMISEFSLLKEHLTIGDFKIYSGFLPKDFVLKCWYCNHHMDYTLEEFTCFRKSPLTYECIICNESGKLKRSNCTSCKIKSISSKDGYCLNCE